MEKKLYKKGFTLGKFLPPHAGHLHLIRSAMSMCEEMTVLVCSIRKEPIPGALRYQWMKEIFPDANIIHVTDEVPSYPHEHPDFDTIWTALLSRNISPDTEVFFSSESYGDDVARWLGIKHEMIDENRSAVPVSGTAIRDYPFQNWNFIPGNVKPYFTKRIVLTGPESSGKTTMAQLLAEYFKTEWVEEYGREYFVNHGGKLTIHDIPKIAEGQLRLENEKLKMANRLLFCDTDLIVTQIWSEIYFKSCPPEVIEKSHEQTYDLFLLMDIDFPWQDDGTREFPHLRKWHFSRIKEELEKRKLPFGIISGSIEERKKTIVDLIRKKYQL